jgi:two-component system, sensor histidine kinase and response regulator
MLAEDTPTNQKLMARILQKRGHTVELAENGREAVDLIRRSQFDVALMDVQMPVMNGFEATAAIRALEEESHTHLPIVALTAHAMQDDCERCLRAGMDGYIAKPFDIKKFIEVVERLGQHPSPKPPRTERPKDSPL